jgi:hypothetical protein
MLETAALYSFLVPSLLASFSAYASWYFVSAKRYAPLTKDEVRTLWEIHKQKASCKARHCKRIVRGKKLIGFRCGCGHTHVQKRPMV